MSLCQHAFINLLEWGTVSLQAGTADDSYPLTRLYDRNIGREFRTTAAVTTAIQIDQGSSGSGSIDRLLVPSGHNLNGMTLDVRYSDNGSAWSYASQWTGAAGLINQSWVTAVHRYWRFVITSPASIPRIPELFFTSTQAWTRNPSRPSGDIDPAFNVKREETAGGQSRFLVMGAARRHRAYRVERCSASMATSILTLNDYWAGSSPFWFCDPDGNWIFGELLSPIRMREVSYGVYSFEFDFQEVLA
jgi:hypothetical protein